MAELTVAVGRPMVHDLRAMCDAIACVVKNGIEWRALADLIEDAIDQLASEGPTLGRPLADRVKASRYHNMKELRPPSAGTTEIRMLFAFDPGARRSSS